MKKLLFLSVLLMARSIAAVSFAIQADPKDATKKVVFIPQGNLNLPAIPLDTTDNDIKLTGTCVAVKTDSKMKDSLKKTNAIDVTGDYVIFCQSGQTGQLFSNLNAVESCTACTPLHLKYMGHIPAASGRVINFYAQ